MDTGRQVSIVRRTAESSLLRVSLYARDLVAETLKVTGRRREILNFKFARLHGSGAPFSSWFEAWTI